MSSRRGSFQSFFQIALNRITGRNQSVKNRVELNLLALEARLNPAPNLLVPSTSAAAPLGMVAGATLPFSGALEIDLLDTPTPASTGNFSVTINASAGTANVNTTGLPNVVVSSNNSAAVTLSGPLSELNSALATLTYSNPTAAATPATLALTARDSASTPLSDSKTVYIRAFDPATAPTITTALANVNYYAETTTVTEAAISFTVSDPQGSAGVTVTGTSSNTNLILNTDIVVAGTYPNFTVALKHQANVTGTALITLKVSDGTNFTTKSFNVSVAPAAQYYWDIVAGNGTAGITNGTGTAATFNGPWQVAVDSVFWSVK